MFPNFNSFPHHPNQGQGDGVQNASSRQVKSQTGRAPIPVNGSMAHMNMASGFMNAPNFVLPMQNNQLGMQQMGPQGLNAVPGLLLNNMVSNANQLNMFQPPGQFPLNGSMGFPNMQFALPNAVQALNQLLAMHMSNPSQIPQINGFPGSNHAMGTQNPLLGLLQQINQGQQNLGSPAMGPNGFKPMAPVTAQSNQAEGSQNWPSPVCNTKQENSNTDRGGATGSPSTFTKNFPRKDFTRNPNGESSRLGQKSHFHRMKNGRGKFDNRDGHKGKGSGTGTGRIENCVSPDSVNQADKPKRCYWMTYTAKEIEQWREERRKNHPSNINLKKKLVDVKIRETNAIARREQLKEILAKQAELGVEVAEIPKHYLLDTANVAQERQEKQPFSKGRTERFQNRFDKRRKHDHWKDRFKKKQRLGETTSPRPPILEKNQPTLLQKLLSKDVQRDKVRLLQVFRFMVMNSFFQDWPKETLKFPVVTVNEGVRGNGLETTPDTVAESLDGGCDFNDDDGEEEDDEDPLGGHGLDAKEEKEEEEGEITD